MGGLERDLDSDDDEPYRKPKGEGGAMNEGDLLKQMLEKNMMNLPGATPMNT